MDNYQLLIDVWEGSLDIDEGELQRAGVAGIIIRINDISGGHHADENFLAQWEQAQGFIRWPYFVYNPWISGAANFDWLTDHLPKDAPERIAIDVEVVKAGYSPVEYAANVQGMINQLCGIGMAPVIYTGQWFLPNLSKWPACEYWWAQYPYALYPASAQNISWSVLKELIASLTWWPATSCKVGPCHLWQCSGDRLKLPGCAGRAVDVNVFQGSLADLRAWVGMPPETPELSDAEKLKRLWDAHPELH